MKERRRDGIIKAATCDGDEHVIRAGRIPERDVMKAERTDREE